VTRDDLVQSMRAVLGPHMPPGPAAQLAELAADVADTHAHETATDTLARYVVGTTEKEHAS
jgi:hypothetical protein